MSRVSGRSALIIHIHYQLICGNRYNVCYFIL